MDGPVATINRIRCALSGGRSPGRLGTRVWRHPHSQRFNRHAASIRSSIGSSPGAAVGRPPTPKQRIHFYSADEWEEFVLEYATGLSQQYVQIKRIGGSNDRGADIAAFLTRHGFEGIWDCFQCKHYDAALLPSDAYPEMFKLLKAIVEGHYTLPRRYLFMAPRGCGPTLSRLLSSPAQLRSKFLERLDGGKPLGAGLDAALVSKIRAEAEVLDYSVFTSVEMHEILEIHKKTRYHADRFEAPLPARPAVGHPPETPQEDERRYIEQLLTVYSERYSLSAHSTSDIEVYPHILKHFSRQREAFYSAESLRLFARDSVLPGTFESLQDEVFEGVIETHSRDFATGMERLTSVLEGAIALSLTKNRLIVVSDPRDKRGICHQLANGDRLVWCDEA